MTGQKRHEEHIRLLLREVNHRSKNMLALVQAVARQTRWLWGNGSLTSIEQVVENGVPHPKEYRDPMPPKGGAQLTPEQVQAVSAYVWALNYQKTAKTKR